MRGVCRVRRVKNEYVVFRLYLFVLITIQLHQLEKYTVYEPNLFQIEFIGHLVSMGKHPVVLRYENDVLPAKSI